MKQLKSNYNHAQCSKSTREFVQNKCWPEEYDTD